MGDVYYVVIMQPGRGPMFMFDEDEAPCAFPTEELARSAASGAMWAAALVWYVVNFDRGEVLDG